MTESRLVSEWEKFLGGSQVAAVIFSKNRQCWSILWQATGERSFFSACRGLSVCCRLPKRARKNSSLEEGGINTLCLLIGQCVAELLGWGIDLREKIDLWLLQSHLQIKWQAAEINCSVHVPRGYQKASRKSYLGTIYIYIFRVLYCINSGRSTP